MIVVQVLILDPPKTNGPKSKNEYILQVDKWVCWKKAHFFHMKHQDWLIDLHSMKAR